MSDLTALSAVELRGKYLSRSLTPSEGAEAQLEWIAVCNPMLNAFVRVDESGSMEAARASSDRYARGVSLGPLDGVPIAVKDNIAVAGLPRPGAVVAYKDQIASADATVVGKLRAAGAVIPGMLNMDEAAFGTTTESELYGRCQNPLRAGYTPGGSSGGAGAAVAAGMCVAALGTDTLGSVRIPASYCGVVGFKPSHGMIDVDGVMALSPTLDHVGVLARTVRDAALVFEAIADRGLERGGHRADAPALDHELTLGVLDVDEHVEADVNASFTNVVASLERAGIRIVAADSNGVDLGHWRRSGLLIAEAEAALVHEAALAENPEGFSSQFRSAVDYARRQSALRMAAAYGVMEDARRWLDRQLARCHALLTPTTPQRAFAFGNAGRASAAAFTGLANLAGTPAVALPVGDGGDLPMSIQLVGPFGSDRWLLALGERIASILVSAR